MDKWQEYLKTDERIRLSFIKADRDHGVKEARRIRDRAYRRMIRAMENGEKDT